MTVGARCGRRRAGSWPPSRRRVPLASPTGPSRASSTHWMAVSTEFAVEPVPVMTRQATSFSTLGHLRLRTARSVAWRPQSARASSTTQSTTAAGVRSGPASGASAQPTPAAALSASGTGRRSPSRPWTAARAGPAGAAAFRATPQGTMSCAKAYLRWMTARGSARRCPGARAWSTTGCTTMAGARSGQLGSPAPLRCPARSASAMATGSSSGPEAGGQTVPAEAPTRRMIHQPTTCSTSTRPP
mmetsp:Transcript_70498/g.217788  ORF Transcript_70498/g.217788 Transcript_70498/m.217788 type:complete len:244 (-) Transcript_70498:342-1073(-)